MNWKEEMKMKPKLRTYRSLKYDLRKEEYLEVIKDKEEEEINSVEGGNQPSAHRDRKVERRISRGQNL